MTQRSRRAFLAGIGALGSGLAGCTTNSSNTSTSPTTGTQRTTETETPAPTTADPTTTTAGDIPTVGPPLAGVEAFEDAVPGFLQQWDIPGASVAVMKDGRLVFTRGYGLADKQRETPVQPNALFRVGSLSKPITAVTVLDLVEHGQLSLDDPVFEILDQFLPDEGPTDQRLNEATVRQHLRHTAGWDLAEIGLRPSFAPSRVAEAEGVEPPASADTIIRFLAKQQLGADPGSRFNYANVGYIVLARVIEAVTGTDYETYVRENVLTDLGISQMEIGATQLDGRLEDEVRYYGHRTVESPFSADKVPGPYGRFYLPALDGAGGWVGSVVDLLRFVRSVNYVPETDNVLGTETLNTMTSRPDVPSWNGEQQFYGMGWYVIDGGETAPTLWHNGSLPGSYGYIIHSGNENLTLAALFNSRSPDRQSRTFNSQAQQMLIRALRRVSTWPDRDMFNRFE
jgi:N-acyl-D-amino-acid deacylase